MHVHFLGDHYDVYDIYLYYYCVITRIMQIIQDLWIMAVINSQKVKDFFSLHFSLIGTPTAPSVKLKNNLQVEINPPSS